MRRLPNILTVVRFVLTFVFIYCLNREGIAFILMAFLFFSLASLTDYYDGYFAKKHNWVTNFGKIMDPIADKFLILAAFYVFVRMDIVMAWMFYLILAREVVLTTVRVAVIRKRLYLAAEKAGKLKTVSQIVAVLFILCVILLRRIPGLSPWMDATGIFWTAAIHAIMLVAVFLTLVSGFSYLWNNRKSLIPA